MARKPAVTKEQALDFLEQRGLLTKARSEYKDAAYVKRLASDYRRAEEAGKKTSRAAARGHRSTEHVIPNYQAGPLPEGVARDRFSEQYRVSFPETVSDLKTLKTSVDRRRRAKGLPKANPYVLTIYGSSRYKHPKNPTGIYTLQTLSLHVDEPKLQDYLKNHPTMPILEFVNRLWQPVKQEDDWEEIISIAMKVGNQ